MPIPKTAELLKPLADDLKKILERLDVIEAKLEKPIEPEKEIKVEEIKKIVVEENPIAETKFPVPSEYLEMVHSMLNSKFGVTITPEPSSPMFRFTIVVPREYSPLSDAEYESAKADLRPIMLNYSDGVPGVRAWVEKVWNNFNAETKAKIKADQQTDGH